MNDREAFKKKQQQKWIAELCLEPANGFKRIFNDD